METKQLKLIEEINQLLKGTFMGIFMFNNLVEKLKSDELKKMYNEIIIIFKNHEIGLTRQIKELNGIPVNSAGFKGTIVDMMEMAKNLLIINDMQVLEEGIKSIKAANNAIRIFDNNHFVVSAELQKDIVIMKDDYASIYHKLHKCLITTK
ncbi:MAG: DUF2383 domain-containing protein [Erysipelotrichaceae bacterium]